MTRSIPAAALIALAPFAAFAHAHPNATAMDTHKTAGGVRFTVTAADQ